MKKKNGFTLIELLAIIVILAIIAVITVPIILDIIDNSKKGAASDSAYGYKDSINKYFLTKLSEDSSYNIPNNSYKTSDLKTLGVSLSGKEPESNSWVTIEKNKVINACLQFDEYKVEIKNGEVDSTTKGDCIELQIPSCPGCVFAFYTSAKFVTTSTNQHANAENTVLSDYKQSYIELKDSNNEQRKYFLGHVLENGTNKILKSFACGIESDKAFCLEGNDASKYENNINIIKNIYTNCDLNTSNGCSGSNINVGIQSIGQVTLSLSTNSGKMCTATSDGISVCSG